MSIEELTTKLTALASQANLSGAQLEEAKTTMKALKKLGLSNEEISQISGGRWSPSTVKGYCTGISAPSPSPWDSVAAALADVIASGLSLGDIGSALAVTNYLKSKKASIDDVTELINTAASCDIELATLTAQSAVLKEAGLSLNDIPIVVAMIEQLEQYGMTTAHLPVLVDVAKEYGDIKEVLQAVSTYGSIQEMNKEIEANEKSLKKIKTDYDAVGQLLEKRETKLKELAGPLEAIEKASKLGFGEKELLDISKLCTDHGGPKAVLTAFKDYSALKQIREDISKAKSDLAT